MKKLLFSRISLSLMFISMGFSCTTEAYNRYRDRRRYSNDNYERRERSHSGLKGALGGGVTGAAIGGLAGGGKGAAIGGPVGLLGGLAIGKAVEHRRDRRARRRENNNYQHYSDHDDYQGE